jgi:hypothetical protein
MTEHRRSKRKPPDQPIEVVNAMTGHVVGQIGNLSSDGMMLVANEPFRDDALYQFTFSLPDAGGERIAIEVGMHEQWGEPAGGANQHWAGFRLIDISERDAEVLRAWVERDSAK